MATAKFADGTDPVAVAGLVAEIEQSIGPIHFINYNIGAQVGSRSVDKTSYRIFEVCNLLARPLIKSVKFRGRV